MKLQDAMNREGWLSASETRALAEIDDIDCAIRAARTIVELRDRVEELEQQAERLEDALEEIAYPVNEEDLLNGPAMAKLALKNYREGE